MICTIQNGRIRVRHISSYSMIVKIEAIQLRWTNVPSCSDQGTLPSLKPQGPIYRRVASQARELTRANERALTALDRKSVVPLTPNSAAKLG